MTPPGRPCSCGSGLLFVDCHGSENTARSLESKQERELARMIGIRAKRRLTVNADQTDMLVTEDKVRLCLKYRLEDHAKGQASSLDARRAKQAWVGPLTFALSILLAFVTTTFIDWGGVDKVAWRSVFITIFLAAAALFVWLAYRAIRVWRYPPLAPDVEETINAIVTELQAASARTVDAAESAPPLIPVVQRQRLGLTYGQTSVPIAERTSSPDDGAQRDALAEEEAQAVESANAKRRA